MKTFTISLLLALASLGSSAQRASVEESALPKGAPAPASSFTGNVWVYSIANDSLAHWSIAKVTFEAGAHSNWHTHPGKQVLTITQGTGYLKEDGKPLKKLHKGDIVTIEPGVKHWHGATHDSDFVQIVTNLGIEKGVVNWLERIDEAEYPRTHQAKAPKTRPFGKEAFIASNTTTLRWLGMAGFLINSRGTTMMIDPLLKDFDMPIMIDFPIKTEDVPKLDAILVTHSDNDHFSIPTNRDLKSVTKSFHSTHYVNSLMMAEGFPSFGHNPHEKFKVGPVTVKLTPADHAWQNAYPGTAKRTFKNEDCTGFLIETPDGTIWATGDSRLMDEHLNIMPPPDAILFDFSDSEWHFTFEGAVKLANAYPNTPLLLCHWGSVDAPDFTPFNGDPEKLKKHVVNPERIHVLAPGEPYILNKLKQNSKK